jgi:predicted nucleotidyltransferase component of viral defense system
MTLDRYVRQVALLVRTVPEIAEEEDFALKGGTAINLFVRDLPRLSVDIDLVYLPVAEREASLAAVTAGLDRIVERINRRRGGFNAKPISDEGTKLEVSDGTSRVIVEANPVIRGTVFAAELRSVTAKVEEQFGFAEMQVVSFPDLYAGKIAAALDRQHPRDLFDIHYLFEAEGLSDDLFKAFLVYLVSHKRPPHELLAPNPQNLTKLYETDFIGMTVEPVPLDTLLEVRQRLVQEIQQRARGEDARAFLISFFAMEPDWAKLGLAADIAALPAVMWKMRNLEILRIRGEAHIAPEPDLVIGRICIQAMVDDHKRRAASKRLLIPRNVASLGPPSGTSASVRRQLAPSNGSGGASSI